MILYSVLCIQLPYYKFLIQSLQMRDEKLEMSKITTTFVTCFSDKMYTFFPKFKGISQCNFCKSAFLSISHGICWNISFAGGTLQKWAKILKLSPCKVCLEKKKSCYVKVLMSWNGLVLYLILYLVLVICQHHL